MYVVLWTAFNGSWEFATLIGQLAQVTSGITVNEMINFKKYEYLHKGANAAPGANALSKGTLRNCMAFWRGEHGPDVYEIVEQTDAA